MTRPRRRIDISGVPARPYQPGHSGSGLEVLGAAGEASDTPLIAAGALQLLQLCRPPLEVLQPASTA
ncbi:hypothetical protein G5714_001585 [Onychostoma macrolepis]|uniref:Uncharacterized protein n=1 Tax=Onychostoma macrolepis TaxID=369639 RepID=A0A7J6DCN8_9TELE|nr:hypothetical protein G5714_001585 [Onychostoma macrolepis]